MTLASEPGRGCGWVDNLANGSQELAVRCCGAVSEHPADPHPWVVAAG